MVTAFTNDPSSGQQPTTVRILSDNATTNALVNSITGNCSQYLSADTSGQQDVEFFNPLATNYSMPRPEQAIQYYRASSVVLTLDGYNDTAALNNSAAFTSQHVPLPDWVDQDFLGCINTTIGEAVVLVTSQRNVMQNLSMLEEATNQSFTDAFAQSEEDKKNGLINIGAASTTAGNPFEDPILASTLGLMFIVMKLLLL